MAIPKILAFPIDGKTEAMNVDGNARANSRGLMSHAARISRSVVLGNTAFGTAAAYAILSERPVQA